MYCSHVAQSDYTVCNIYNNTVKNISHIKRQTESGHGAMGRASVSHMRGPVIDSQEDYGGVRKFFRS